MPRLSKLGQDNDMGQQQFGAALRMGRIAAASHPGLANQSEAIRAGLVNPFAGTGMSPRPINYGEASSARQEFGASSGSVPSGSPLKNTASSKANGAVAPSASNAGIAAARSPLANVNAGSSPSLPGSNAVKANAKASSGSVAGNSVKAGGLANARANFKYFTEGGRMFAFGRKNKKKGR